MNEFGDSFHYYFYLAHMITHILVYNNQMFAIVYTCHTYNLNTHLSQAQGGRKPEYPEKSSLTLYSLQFSTCFEDNGALAKTHYINDGLMVSILCSSESIQYAMWGGGGGA